jgi:hypothetical protein
MSAALIPSPHPAEPASRGSAARRRADRRPAELGG